jgi:putative ABC transport system ATP-binding protein
VTPLIELRGVGKSYQEGSGRAGGTRHLVLDGVDQRFERGEIVALLGRSGSGKSTLLNLIAGIDLPDRGEVLVDGRPIHRMSDLERTLHRRSVGFVFQFFNLVPTLTVGENLLLPLELASGRRAASQRGRALDLLGRVGLADRAGSFPDTLSGGEQQRVALARALVHQPRLVLADEPTGNLDEETGETVLDLLRSLCGGDGPTLLMATHSRAVADIAHRVLHLEHGKLVAHPSP